MTDVGQAAQIASCALQERELEAKAGDPRTAANHAKLARRYEALAVDVRMGRTSGFSLYGLGHLKPATEHFPKPE